MRIETKEAMYKLYNANEFGNRPETWDSLAHLMATGGDGPFAIRARKPNHPLFKHNIPRRHMEKLTRAACKRYGLTESELCFIRPLPLRGRTIQGEMRYSYDGRLVLHYSLLEHHMREALAKGGRVVEGLQAAAILRARLDHSDVDHLYSLLDRFPDHAVEFTGFSQRVGLQNTRMVVWECRWY